MILFWKLIEMSDEIEGEGSVFLPVDTYQISKILDEKCS